jgi:hypothetical protein
MSNRLLFIEASSSRSRMPPNSYEGPQGAPPSASVGPPLLRKSGGLDATGGWMVEARGNDPFEALTWREMDDVLLRAGARLAR